MLSLRVKLSRKQLKVLAILALLVLSFLVISLWHIGDSTVGLNSYEAQARQSSAKLHNITTNPVNAPHSLLQHSLQAFGHHGAFWMRLPSVIIAVIILIFAFMLLRAWFGIVSGLLGTLVLMTTPFFLQSARSATPNILLMMPLIIVFCYSWLKKSKAKQKIFALRSTIIAIGICLYVPGLIWLLLAGGIAAHKQLLNTIKGLSKRQQLISGAIFIVLILPLIIGCLKDINVLKSALLIPQHTAGLGLTLKHIGQATISLVWHTPSHIDTFIGRIAILNALETVLAFVGIFAMWLKARKQLYVMLAMIVYAIIMAGLNNNVLILMLSLPAIAILMTAGLRYLYVEWRSVFPVNPIPRTFAVFIMCVLVSLQVIYGVSYSLVAWPHTLPTRQSYVIK